MWVSLSKVIPPPLLFSSSLCNPPTFISGLYLSTRDMSFAQNTFYSTSSFKANHPPKPEKPSLNSQLFLLPFCESKFTRNVNWIFLFYCFTSHSSLNHFQTSFHIHLSVEGKNDPRLPNSPSPWALRHLTFPSLPLSWNFYFSVFAILIPFLSSCWLNLIMPVLRIWCFPGSSLLVLLRLWDNRMAFIHFRYYDKNPGMKDDWKITTS